MTDPPGSARLPDGFTVELDRRTRRLVAAAPERTALLGGSPARLMFLSPVARRLLGGGDRLVVGDATGAALARRLLDAGVAHPVPTGLPDPPGAHEVTVVIPVRDRSGELRRLLAALTATAPGLAEVLVVDDGSADPAACRAAAEATGARWLQHPVSLGASAARNTGLAAADTEFVALLDSDVVPEPGWLPPLLAHLCDPTVALVAPRVTGLPTPRPGWLTRYEGLRSSLDLGPDPAPVLPRSRVAYVPSAALLVRRDALGSGFRPGLAVAEDVELELRLHAAGWRLRYEPGSRVAHEHRVAPVSWWTRKAFYGTGAAPLAVAHPGSVPPAVLAPWTAAVSLLLAWQRRPAALAAVGVTGAAVLRLRRTLGSGLRHPTPTAARLTGLGLATAASQVAGLLLRHWWPVTVAACALSRRVRRLTVAAALLDGAHDWWTHRPVAVQSSPAQPGPAQPGLDPARYLVAHRLDDVAYGTGLWWGALRARTAAPLLPVLVWRRRPRTPVRPKRPT